MASRVDRHLDRILGALLPPRCVLCEGRGQPPCLDLCVACEAALPASAAPLGTGVPPLDRCFAPFDYAFPLDHLVRRLKYGAQLASGRVLGTLLGEAVRSYALHLDVDCLVPVPLHPLRHAERGYNQAMEIAGRAGRILGRSVHCRMLHRRRDTRTQVGLPRAERRANVEGAFVAGSSARGLRIAIVDDVFTTGGTVAAAAGALLAAGAHSVDAWCIARAARLEQLEERLDWWPVDETRHI